MEAKDEKKLSKFISLLLRHKPGNLKLDKRGCCHIEELLEVLNANLKFAVKKEDVIRLTLPPDDPNAKTRFEVEGDFIRAGHGHSIHIEGYEEIDPVAPLYHATITQHHVSIFRDGLLSMNRQKVHLSYSKAITIEAAKRQRGSICLLTIDVEAAQRLGVKFYKSADHRIVLSDDIPKECLAAEFLF